MSEERTVWSRIGLTGELYRAEKQVSEIASDLGNLRSQVFSKEHSLGVWTARRDELLSELNKMAASDFRRENPIMEDEPAQPLTPASGDGQADAENSEWKLGDKKPWSLITAYRDGYEGRKQIAPQHPVYMAEWSKGAADAGKDVVEPQPPAHQVDEREDALLDQEQGAIDESSSRANSTDAADEASSNPYEEGKAAHAQGAELWQNPYPTSHDNPLLDPGPSQEFLQWEDGFLDADLEARKATKTPSELETQGSADDIKRKMDVAFNDGVRLYREGMPRPEDDYSPNVDVSIAAQCGWDNAGNDHTFGELRVTNSPDSSDAQVFAHGILKDAERKASEPKHSVIGRMFGGTKSFAKAPT